MSAAPAPSRVWISVAGKPIPEWVQAFMTSGAVADDGSFDLETPLGIVHVERGFAAFEYSDRVYASATREMPEVLALAAADHPAVLELTEKAQGFERPRSRRAKSGSDKPLNFKPVIGTPPAPQFASVDALLIDDTYQRSIEGGASQKLIQRIAENWDWRLCLPLLVSRRGGQLFVIDGQHRKEAADLRGDIPHLPVVVFDFDDAKAEAELFVAANRTRRNMSKLDDFHAAVAAGDKKSIAIHDAVASAGLKVGRIQAWQYWKPGEVVFVAAIGRALNSVGKAVVEQSLGIIARAFDGVVLTGAGAIFEALCALLQEREQSGDPIDPALMEMVLSQVGISGWKEAVDGIDAGDLRAEAMLGALMQAYSEAAAQ